MLPKQFTLLNPTKSVRNNLTGLKLNATLLLALGLTGVQAQPDKMAGAVTNIDGNDSIAAITAESLHKGLVLHLPFDQDETGDNKVTDASSHENNGKASGVRWTADGKKGGAYEFMVDGDQIEVPNNASLNPEQFTLAAWIKTSFTSDKWQRIFDKSYSQGYALSIAANWRGNLWNGLANLEIGPGTHFSLSKTMVADGQWHQVVATFDGTEQILFVDGKPEGIPLRWNIPGQAGVTDFNLVIGCNRSNLNEDDFGVSFHGLIDEPMMWNRALSLQEVAFLFESQGGKIEKQTVQSEGSGSYSSIVNNKPELSLLKGVVHFTDCDVRFRTAGGVNVFVDPVGWPTDDAVIKSGMVRPDLILITHSHYDHFQPTILREYLLLNPKAILAGPPDVVRMAREKGMEVIEIKPGQNYSMAGIKFSTVPAYFLEGDSHPKSNGWMGYVLQLDRASYYVTGDTQPLPEMADFEVDVLFPLLAGCGGNLAQALQMVELTKAHIVVPVHTNGRVLAIKQFIDKLSEETQGAYYLDGKLVSMP